MNTTTIREVILSLHREFKKYFIERDEEILGAFLAILSNENILYLGPPGTAKTYLAQSICGSIEDADFFYYLLTRFTTPEEIFGPLSIKSLENDEFRRKIDGCLPSSHIAFLDEIFKANSSILNSLLTILNERRFHNGTDVIDIPTLTVFGASNELPEDDENLEALYDRFLFRYDIHYIQNEENVKDLLFSNQAAFTPSKKLSVHQIREIRSVAMGVEVPKEVQAIILSLKKDLEKGNIDGEQGIWASDRRWKKIISVLKVASVANGYSTVGRTMLLLLQHMLWDLPQHKEEIRILLIDKIVSGGVDRKKLEQGIKNLNNLIHDAYDLSSDEQLPVPVFVHDNEGNNQRILTYHGLIKASKNNQSCYFTVENSFSTFYLYSQIMDILKEKYGFTPKSSPKDDKAEICKKEYAFLESQYLIYKNSVNINADQFKEEIESNIWLTSQDKEELRLILHEKERLINDLSEKMSDLALKCKDCSFS